MNEAFGMMDEGYFKSRSDILKFVNDLLQVNMTKIESLGQGAVYCQILDAMFPGKVPLSKVNWKAKLDWEFVNNLKVLQSAFTKIGIKKVIEVEKLAKCKYQDNLEMIQWLMRFYECNGNKPLADYDAVARRKGVEPDFSYADKIIVPKIFNLATQKQENEKAGGQTGTVNSSSKAKQEGVASIENENNNNKQEGIKQVDKIKLVKEKNNNLNKIGNTETKHTATQAGLKVTKPEIKVKDAALLGKKEVKSNHLTVKQPSTQTASLKLQKIKDVMSMHSLDNTGKLQQIAEILGVIQSSNQGQQQNHSDSQSAHKDIVISRDVNNEHNLNDQEILHAQEENNDLESHLDEHVQEIHQETENNNSEEEHVRHDQQDQEGGEEEQGSQQEIEGEVEKVDEGNLHDQEEQQHVEQHDEEEFNQVEETTQKQDQHTIPPEENIIPNKLPAEIQEINGLLDNLIDNNDADLLHSGHDQEEEDEII